MSKQKTILFKIWQFPQLSETFITAQIITAIKCGFEVSILVKEVLDFEESKQHKLLNTYAIPEKIILENFKIPKNKLLRVLKIFFLSPGLLKNLFYLIRFLKEQKQFRLSHVYKFHFYAKLKEFDMIHVQYGTNVNPIDKLKKIGFYQSKLIVSFHGHDAFFPINGFIENNGYYDDLFDYGDLIVANTPYLAQKIEGLGCSKERLKIIPVGVDTEFFRPEKKRKKSSNCFQLITVGRLNKVKGHQYAIEAVKQVKERGLAVYLTIIGEGKERKNLEKIINEYNLEDEVSLIGKKSQTTVKNYLLSSDLYILAAVPVENQRRETQGLATLEAQACGLPAVVFDSGGVKFTILDNKTGFVVPEFDVASFAEKIEKLIKNEAMRYEFSENAVRFIKENYSENTLIKKWKKLYS